MNKIKWQGVCTVKKIKKFQKRKKKKERTKETNYIYLLAHIMLRALLFKNVNNLIFDVGRWKDCREIEETSFRGKPTVHVLNIKEQTYLSTSSSCFVFLFLYTDKYKDGTNIRKHTFFWSHNKCGLLECICYAMQVWIHSQAISDV